MEEKKTFLIIFFSFCLVQIWGGGWKEKKWSKSVSGYFIKKKKRDLKSVSQCPFNSRGNKLQTLNPFQFYIGNYFEEI